MSQLANLSFRRYSATDARAIRDAVQMVYTGSYVDAIESGDPFQTSDAFMQRFDAYTRSDSSRFDMVVAFIDDQAVGQTWGWPLSSKSQWWNGLKLDAGDIDEFIREDGFRTFGYSELMVRTEFTGKHVASGLHRELLLGRTETRATLLVNPVHTRAYSTYIRWGWYRAGTLRPAWPDAPLFDVLIHDLPLAH